MWNDENMDHVYGEELTNKKSLPLNFQAAVTWLVSIALSFQPPFIYEHFEAIIVVRSISLIW